MGILFGAHNFYDLKSGPILAPSHNPFVNTYYKHGIAKYHLPHLLIDLKLLHFHR